MQQIREISIPEAIVSAVNARKSMDQGDQMGYILALKQMELQAERFEWDKRNDLLAQSQKAWEQQTAVDKEMRRQALDKEIRDAYEAGDMDRVRFLQSQQAGSIVPFQPRQAAPVKPEEWDLMRQRYEAGEISQEQWDAFKNKQTGVEPPEPPKVSDFIQKLNDLQSLNLPREEYDLRFEQLVDDFVNAPEPPTPDKPRQPTSQDKALAEIDRQVAAGIISQEQGDMEKRRIVGAYDPRGRATDKAADTPDVGRTYMNSLPITDPIRIASNNTSFGLTKDELKNLNQTVQGITGGKAWADLSDNEKSVVSDLYAQAVLTGKQAGGEIVQRERAAIRHLRNEVPYLKQHLDTLSAEGIEVGRVLQFTEGAFRLTGTTSNPKVAAAATSFAETLNSLLNLRSGAQVNEQEVNRYRKMLVDLGKSNKLNRAILNELSQITDRKMRAYWDERLDSNMVNVIMKDTKIILSESLPAGYTQERINKMAELMNVSPEEVIRQIRAR